MRAKYGFVPAAVLAPPGANEEANAERYPAHEPQPERENHQDQVKRVIDFRPDEDLLVLAPGTVGVCLFLSHLAWKPTVAPNGWHLPLISAK